MAQMEYYSFERVLKELQIEEEELKRLVSEGEIRAFRDDDKMKFKKSDIEGLKKGRMTEPTIILPSGEPSDSSEDSEVLLVEEDTSETLLNIEELEGAEASSASVPTVDFESSNFEDSSPSGTLTEELSFEEDTGSYVLESSDNVLIDSSQELLPMDDSSSAEETFIDSETGLQTEPLEMELDSSSDDYSPVSSDLEISSAEEGLITEPVAEPVAEEVSHPPTAMVSQVVVETPVSSAIMFCLIASTLILLFSGVFMVNILKEIDTPLTSTLTDISFQIVPPRDIRESRLNAHLKFRRDKRERPGKMHPSILK